MAREAHIDPLLQDQLARASGQHSSVAATFTLRNRSSDVLSPKETHSVVKKMLDRIAIQTRTKPSVINVFPHIQSFAVSASPMFVKQLLLQPEIDSAMANEQEEQMLIAPVTVREVSVDEAEGRARPSSVARRKRGR